MSHTISLYDALSRLKNQDDVRLFLKDLCTPKEIQSLSERWRVCQLLEKGDLSYRDIHAATGASLTTIGRVARFLREESNHGYRLVLTQLKDNQSC